MKKLQLKSRKLLRTLFGCLSFTAVAFVFQACYGTGPDPFYDIKLTGTVRARNTNLPIEGIKIVVNDEKFDSGFSDRNGNFGFYAKVPNYNYDGYKPDRVMVYFLDIDGIKNGSFEDQIIIIDPAHKDEVKIHVELEEKQ
jgi:hypothetical protein